MRAPLHHSQVSYLGLVVLFGFLAVGLPDRGFAAQLEPGRYTSPSFGFAISWDVPWFLVEQLDGDRGGVEGVALANGTSLVSVFGSAEAGSEPAVCVYATPAGVAMEAGVADVAVMTDENGNEISAIDDNRAFVAVTFTQTLEDGRAMDFAMYAECRALAAGGLLFIMHMTPAWAYDGEAAAREALLANLVLQSAGETGPAFVAGPWRIAVVGVERDDRLAELGLDEVEDGDWLAVVADVTAWRNEGAMLLADDLTIAFAGDDESVTADPAASASVAEELGAVAPGDDGLAFDAGQTQRVALVFQIADDGDEPALARGGATLPLAEALERGADLTALPEVAGPPALEEARVEEVVDGGAIEVTLVADGSTRTVRLIGVDAPTGDECYAAEAADELAELAGKTIFLEAEGGAAADADELERYVWTEKRDGSRILVNRKVLERGFAEFDAPGDDARFGAWLGETARVAEEEGAGLWTACAEGGAGRIGAEPSATERAGSESDAEASEPAAAPSADDVAYLRQLQEATRTLDVSLMRYGDLVADPRPGDPQWLNQMAFVFLAWALAHDGVEELTPTERYADLHATCLDAIALLDAAAHEQAPNLDAWFAGQTDALDLSGFDLGLLQERYAEAEPALTDCAEGMDVAFAEAGI